MKARMTICITMIIVLTIGLGGCGGGGGGGGGGAPSGAPPTSSGGGGSSACLINSSDAVVNVATEASSVTVTKGTYATVDGNGLWCGENLGVDALSQSTLNQLISKYGCFNSATSKIPPCTPYNALAALDINPDSISFPKSPKPKLRYDLSAHKPTCKQLDIACGGYAIYQLQEQSAKWLFAGSAFETSFSGKQVAEGSVSHFSIFALVELPAPRPVTPPALPPFTAGMVVASEFLVDDGGSITVAIEILRSPLPETGEIRLFRLTGVDPVFDPAQLPANCLAGQTIAEQLSCLLPIGREVAFETGVDGVDNLIRFTSQSSDPAQIYEVRLHAAVDIH